MLTTRICTACGLPLAAVLIVVGCKCWMIARFGTPTPYGDQWGAEAATLYPRYLSGTLQISDLIAAHNEHRILLTRLWSLLLLELNGYWDPILQMLANTLIYGLFVSIYVAAFRPILPRSSWIAFAFFSALIFATPATWGNTLEGFNSQWYFLLLFSLLGLVLITSARAFSALWWLALLSILASYFSMAGGTATGAAAFAISAAQMISGVRKGPREFAALFVLAAATALMVKFVPVVEGGVALKAQTIGQFLYALMEILSWPAAIGITFPPTRVLLAILVYGPASIACVHVFMTRPPLSDRRWLFVALTGWAMMNACILAYGRAAAPVVARNLDAILVGLPLNAASLFYLLHVCQPLQQKRRFVGVVAIWMLPVLIGTGLSAFKQAPSDISERHAFGLAETENLRAYLSSGDIRFLQNNPIAGIPVPDPQFLAPLVTSPIIRALLPPELVGTASAAQAQQRGLARFTGRPIAVLKTFALTWGALLLLPAGLILFALGALQRNSRSDVAPQTTSVGKDARR